MRLIKNFSFFMAALLAVLLLAGTSQAIYFTIQLKNGNEIITDKYTEDSASVIHFYVNEGAVAIPKSIIQSIRASNEEKPQYEAEEPAQGYKEPAAEEEESGEQPAQGAAAATGTAADQLNSINDQLTVIETNLDNLARNKNIYLTQKEQYEQARQKSQEKIDRMVKESGAYAESKGIKENIELEQANLKNIEAKQQELQQRIENNEKMTEAQMRMKQRIESERAAATKTK